VDVLDKIQLILDESRDPENPGPEAMREIMEKVRRIAVIGVSRDPAKAARRVPAYLAAQGYDIVPINPFVDTVLGKDAVDSLEEVPGQVDMVLVFRPSAEAEAIVAKAMDRAEKPVIWLQEGIWGGEAARKARGEGMPVVQNLCAYRVHRAMKEE
jgi:predicted CoA-binding protein